MTGTDIDTERAECVDCGRVRPREELSDKPTDALLCDGCYHSR